MRSALLLVLLALAAAPSAAAQTTPRPAADSIRMAEPPSADEDTADDEDDEAADEDAPEADSDSLPRTGPFSEAGGRGPFTVQSSGTAAPRPERNEVVWINSRPARVAARDTSAAPDTAGTRTGRAAAGTTTPRDTAATRRTGATSRDTASTRRTGQTASTPRDTASTRRTTTPRDTASTRRTGQTASPSRDTASTRRTTARDTAGTRRTGQTTTTTRTTARDTAATRRTGAPRDTLVIRGNGAPTTGARTGTTPAPANRPAPATGSAGRSRTHTVAAGETFYGIARRYGVTSAQLRALNPSVDWESVEIGTVLRLPAAARDSRASTPAATPGNRPAPGRTTQARAATRTHTVAAGETLYGIARRYGVTRQAIIDANNLESDGVRVGQRLVIPPAERP